MGLYSKPFQVNPTLSTNGMVNNAVNQVAGTMPGLQPPVAPVMQPPTAMPPVGVMPMAPSAAAPMPVPPTAPPMYANREAGGARPDFAWRDTRPNFTGDARPFDVMAQMQAWRQNRPMDGAQFFNNPRQPGQNRWPGAITNG